MSLPSVGRLILSRSARLLRLRSESLHPVVAASHLQHLRTAASTSSSSPSVRNFERLHAERTRRPPRKKRPLTAHYDSQYSLGASGGTRHVVAIALAEEIDLAAVAADPGICNLYIPTVVDEVFDDALWLAKRPEYAIDATGLSEWFAFGDGVVVFWNIDSTERSAILRHIEPLLIGRYQSRLAQEEMDTMQFTIATPTDTSRSRVMSDRFCLSARHAISKESNDQRKTIAAKPAIGRQLPDYEAVLERYAFSQAFGASAKVGVWEAQLHTLGEPLADATRELRSGSVPWNQRETLRRAGDFAALRHAVNLDCQLLSRDFYWERQGLEDYFNQAERHFTIDRRVRLLNYRLDYCQQLVEMVHNTQAVKHSNKLEWMIIVLIVIEVIFDLFEFLEHSTPRAVYLVKEEGKDE